MAFNNKHQPKFVLNVAPVKLPDIEVFSGRQPFQSSEHLRELRGTYRDSHIFKRRGDSIVDVPIAGSAKPLGNPEAIRLRADLGIASALVQDAYLRFLLSLRRVVLDFSPLEFLDKENLLASIIGGTAHFPSWIGVYVRYQICLRTFFKEGAGASLILALGVRTANVIDATCDGLIRLGLDLHHRYVQAPAAASDPRLAPWRILAGKVSEAQDNRLLLTDSREQSPSISTDEAYLEPRRENIRLCLRTLFGSDSANVIQRLEARISHVTSGPERLRKAREVIAYLAKQQLELVPGATFRLGDILEQSRTGSVFPATSCETGAVYVFDHGTHTTTWHDKGLCDHGPYDQRTFTPTRPEIAVICQARYRGETEQFVRKLLDGMPSVLDAKGRAPFGQGFQRKYCLDKCQLEFFEAESETPEAYRKAIGRAVQAATDRNAKWNLALIQIEERFHLLRGDDNPYLVSKGSLLLHGIPSQEVEIETMGKPDLALTYILNNVGLACYAKLGGVPWLLQANRGIAHELVIGLGSASLGSGRLSERNRIVGITTVFTGDGNYLLENRTRAVPMDEYPGVLLEALRTSIGQARQSLNWQPRDAVRLVFHAFKPFRMEQIDSVAEVVHDFGDYDLQFAFVHVEENHPYLLFDEAQAGVWDSQSKSRKGQSAPTRGYWLKLNDYESLLVLTGAREVKRPEDGLPTPLLLRLDKASTFRDIRYLTRQVYHFSCHSWRSFFPAPMPITILYSELIAGLLGGLGEMKKWDPQALLGPIGRTRWFL